MKSQLLKARLQGNLEAQRAYAAEIEQRITILENAGCSNMVEAEKRYLRQFKREYKLN